MHQSEARSILRRAVAVSGAAIVLLVSVSACGRMPASTGPSGPESTTPTPVVSPVTDAVVPLFLGMSGQHSIDLAVLPGLTFAITDSTIAGREIEHTGHWIVIEQTPDSGTEIRTDESATATAVKRDEVWNDDLASPSAEDFRAAHN